MNLKVAIITPEYPPLPFPGGVAESVRRISKGLSGFGMAVTVIVMPNSNQEIERPHIDLTEEYFDGEVRVIKLNLPERTNRQSQSAINSACFEWICDFVENEKFNLLHSFYVSSTGFVTGTVSKECEIPFICSIRGNDLHKSLFSPKEFANIKWSLENADYSTFVSKNLHNRAQKLFSLKGPSKVIWNSIDPSEFIVNERKMPSGLKEMPRPVIGIAGSIRQKKGLETLLAACSYLDFNLTVLIVGQIREEEIDYWHKFVFPSLPPNIHIEITGMIPHQEVLNYYRLADIMVISSTHDGCPNVLLETFLAKVPLISTTKGAMKEIIGESQGGLLYSTSNSRELADKINLLLANANIRNRLTENAYSFVTSILRLENEIREWAEVYNYVAPKSVDF